MSSRSFQELKMAIASFTRWQAIAVCIASLRKLLPLFRHISTQEAFRVLQHVLELCTLELSNSSHVHADVDDLISEIHATSDWMCDDPLRLMSAISKPLDICVFCLRAIGSGSAQDEAVRSLSLMRDIIQDFADTSQALIELRLDSNLAEAEVESQERIVDILCKSTKLSERLTDELNKESQTIADQIAVLLPSYCCAYLKEVTTV